MAQRIFGTGTLWGTPLTDASGNAIINPTPVTFAVLQECSVDFSFDLKLLYGQQQFAVDAARGKGKVSGKGKAAQISGALFNNIFFGQGLSSGLIDDYHDVTGTAVPASSPYQITVAPPSSGAWSNDLGVRNSNGVQLVRVSASPITGQYTVASGVYTFAAADTGATMYIDYQYTSSVAGAQKSVIANLPMGAAPTFILDVSMPYKTKKLTWRFGQAMSNKLSIATKMDDFVIPEMDFDMFADANNNLCTWSISE